MYIDHDWAKDETEQDKTCICPYFYVFLFIALEYVRLKKRTTIYAYIGHMKT